MIGVILASGYSRRMGANKLLLPFKNKTMIEAVIEEAISSNLEGIYIVCRNNEIKDVVNQYPINIIMNEEAHEGQSTSIVKAIQEVEGKYDSYMFLMGDQPLINKDFINEIMDFYYNNNSSILVPIYNGKRGTPVVFASKWNNALLELRGDEGGRQIIRQNNKEVLEYEVDHQVLGVDIDNIEDYKKIMLNLQSDR